MPRVILLGPEKIDIKGIANSIASKLNIKLDDFGADGWITIFDPKNVQ